MSHYFVAIHNFLDFNVFLLETKKTTKKIISAIALCACVFRVARTIVRLLSNYSRIDGRVFQKFILLNHRVKRSFVIP